MAIDDRDNLPRQKIREHAIGGIERGRSCADYYQMDGGRRGAMAVSRWFDAVSPPVLRHTRDPLSGAVSYFKRIR